MTVAEKPRVTLAELRWLQAFATFRGLPDGTKLRADEREFVLDWVCDEPHPPSVWLKHRVNGRLTPYICRKGDPLIHELKSLP